MNNKNGWARLFGPAMVLALAAVLVLAGCQGDDEESTEATETSDQGSSSVESAGAGLEDGIYFAQEDGFSERTGWKYMVTLEVQDGEIVDAEWNGANLDGGTDKVTRSKSGAYGMVEKGGAIAPWWEQAEAVEEYLLETQDPTEINYIDEAGSTDAISGATIHVREFFQLAEKALADGPDGLGPYEDGQYHAEQAEFSDSGWKYFVDITVVSGYIVAANWDAYPQEVEKNKKQASIDGEYGMVERGGAIAPWWEQARATEAYLLETQDPADINYTDEAGSTDAISGATIHVRDFFELAQEALADAQ